MATGCGFQWKIYISKINNPRLLDSHLQINGQVLIGPGLDRVVEGYVEVKFGIFHGTVSHYTKELNKTEQVYSN